MMMGVALVDDKEKYAMSVEWQQYAPQRDYSCNAHKNATAVSATACVRSLMAEAVRSISRLMCAPERLPNMDVPSSRTRKRRIAWVERARRKRKHNLQTQTQGANTNTTCHGD